MKYPVFETTEKNRVSMSPLFKGKLGGQFMGAPRNHCLKEASDNIHDSILTDAKAYFEEHADFNLFAT